MKRIFRQMAMSPSMSGPRMFVLTIGLIIAVAGVVAANSVDKIFGIAIILVGAFLIILPLARTADID